MPKEYKLINLQILALQEILKNDGTSIDEKHLIMLELNLMSIPSPIRDEVERMIGEIILANEKTPGLAFGFVTTLLSGACAVLKFVDLSGE